MTLPIERFKDSYQNWRYNPFTAADMAVDKAEDGLIIPASSPFVIQLLELARYNDPSTVSVRCYGVKTDVDQDSALGQTILYVADTTDFSGGDSIIINRGGDREEERIIDTVQGGISLTVTVNLEFTHTAVQEDDVEKYIAFTETAASPTQSQFRVDYPPEDGEGTGLVEFNQNDATKEVRISYKATGSPALAETLDTKISYPAGNPTDGQIVGFISGAPQWKNNPEPHVLVSAKHTASGLTVGHVIRASGATAFAWAQLQHGDLGGWGADTHHAQAHTLASHSSKAHSELSGVSANQHHAQTHTLGSHSDFSTYLNQAVKTTSDVTFGQITAALATTAETANMYVYGGASPPYPFKRSTSAKKYKDKITNLELDSSLIYNLRPVSFNSKCEGDDKDKRFIGLIADEIEKEFPEIIIYNEKHEAESYNSQMLMTLILKEMQVLKEEIGVLKAR